MKTCHVIIGGTYFTEPVGLSSPTESAFFKHSTISQVDIIDPDTICNRGSVESKGDAAFIFGIKHWVRRMRKKRMQAKETVNHICSFIEKSFGKSMPIGMLDDLEIRSGSGVSGRLSSKLLSDFNCQIYLLREYLRGKKYHKRVRSFAQSSISRLEMAQDPMGKKRDLYFRGDDSSKERQQLIKAASRIDGISKKLKVYKGGARAKDKLSPDEFFKQMAESKICLNVMGNGYSCFRYQEIPSVGSILATRNYPLVIEDDYVDMESCIKFDDVFELGSKVKEALQSEHRVAEMTERCKEHFSRYHTTEQRSKDLMEHISCLLT